MKAFLISALCIVAGSAVAGCPAQEEPFLACTFSSGAKRVEACLGDRSASYWFGRANGKAELALTARAGEFAYTPWPGVSRTIWEELSFKNNGVEYVVYGALERIYPENENDEIKVHSSGGITVLKNGQVLAELRCDEGSVSFGY